MKRRLVLLVAGLLLCSVCSCSKSSVEPTITETTAPTATPTPTPAPTPTPIPRLTKVIAYYDASSTVSDTKKTNEDNPYIIEIFNEQENKIRHEEYGSETRSSASLITTYTYNDDGTLNSYSCESKTDGPNKEQFHFEYNEKGQLVKADGMDSIGIKLWFEYTYDDNNCLIERKIVAETGETDEENAVVISTYEYDESARLTSETTTLVSGFTINIALAEDIDIWPESHTQYTYDENKLVLEEIHAEQYHSFSINQNGIMKAKGEKKDIQDETIKYEYNSEGIRTKETHTVESSLGFYAIEYEFDENGHLQAKTVYTARSKYNAGQPESKLIYKYYYE